MERDPMVKDCQNCRYEKLEARHIPCIVCVGANRWEPKEALREGE